MEIIERAYDVLLIGSMLILAVLIICGIIRSVLGPKIADRIIVIANGAITEDGAREEMLPKLIGGGQCSRLSAV